MMSVTPEQDAITLATVKEPLALAEAWRQLRRVESLGYGALYLTVCKRPRLSTTTVALFWGCAPTRVQREIERGLGWLEVWTGLEPAEILERLRALDAPDFAPCVATNRNR